jgi:hypothetical protein
MLKGNGGNADSGERVLSRVIDTMDKGFKFMGGRGVPLYSYVVSEGKDYSWGEWPSDIGLAGYDTLKGCFGNAARLVLDYPDRFIYCEGFGESGIGIPVHHAWAIDRETGLVADPTWEALDRQFPEREMCPVYCGVEFDVDFLAEFLARVGSFGLLDNIDDRWSILREWEEGIK